MNQLSWAADSATLNWQVCHTSASVLDVGITILIRTTSDTSLEASPVVSQMQIVEGDSRVLRAFRNRHADASTADNVQVFPVNHAHEVSHSPKPIDKSRKRGALRAVWGLLVELCRGEAFSLIARHWLAGPHAPPLMCPLR